MLVLCAAIGVLAAASVALAQGHPDALRSLKVRGSLYDIGHAVGQSFGASIRGKLAGEGYQHLWQYIHDSPGSEHFHAMLQAVNASENHRIYLDEVKGMADGANVSFEAALMMQMGDELEILSGEHVDHCTDVLAPLATEEGALSPLPAGVSLAGLLAHNEDGGRINYGLTYLLEADITDRREPEASLTAYCYPGQLPTGAFGFNSHGLFFSTNGLFPKSIDTKAIPRHFVSRRLLSLRTVDEALRELEETRIACGFSANIGHTGVKQKLWNVEVSSGGLFSALEVSSHLDASPGAYSFHMNEFLRLEVPQTPDPSSDHRLARALDMPPPLSISAALSILGDTHDPVYPIYRNATPPDQYATLATATFEVYNDTTRSGSAGRMSIQLNNPKECKPLVVVDMK